MQEIVLVVPCFNEAKRWDAERFEAICKLNHVSMLFVNDGSVDSTGKLLDDFAVSGRATTLHLEKNVGKAEAVRLGMAAALAETSAATIGFLDADGAFALDDVARFAELSQQKQDEGYDAVWSSRVALSGRAIDRQATRHYIGRGVATALSLAYPKIPYDSQSGFKLFARSRELSEVLQTPFATRWIFEVEMLVRWQRRFGRPMRIWEEPVLQWRDVPGSKIKGRETARIAREIARVIHMSRRRSP